MPVTRHVFPIHPVGKRFLLAHNTPSIAHPFVAGWVFVFLVLLSCAGARCAASSLSLSSRAWDDDDEDDELNINPPTPCLGKRAALRWGFGVVSLSSRP